MEDMEVSQNGVDAKSAGVKRKARRRESRHKKQQTGVPRIVHGCGTLPIPGTFLKLRDTLELCIHPETVLESVPPGIKSNVFFVIDDSINSLKRERDEPPKYSDDCGEWKSRDFTRNFYVQMSEGNIMCMKARDNLFYKDSHVKGGAFMTPLNPQPDPNTLIRVYRRIFECGKRSYRRRVTAIAGYGMRSVALVEYCDTNNAVALDQIRMPDQKVVQNAEKSTDIGVTSEPLPGTKENVQNAEQNSGTAVNSKDVTEVKEDVVLTAEKSTNIDVTSKHSPRTVENVQSAEISTHIAKNSKHVLGTKEKVVHEVKKSTRIAEKSKRALGSKKKVVHRVVKRPRVRHSLNRTLNVMKRPRGRPPSNSLQNVVKRPRGRPPLRNKKPKYDVKTNHSPIRKLHTKSKRCKNPTPEESKTVGRSSLKTRGLLRNEKLVRKNRKQASHKPDYTTTATAMQKKGTSPMCHEDIFMVGMIENNPSVKEVIHRKSKPPCVIIYSDEQFSDMKRNLECESVVGVDCTQKFGDCYVTMTVYQNSRALHKETNEPLLFLGPVYLHWDSEVLTYVSFFSHIMGKLQGIEPTIEVRLGNYEGLPLFQALKFSFPASPYLLDCWHFKGSVNRELPAIVYGKPKLCSAIEDKIFGKEGIINSPCLSVFENAISEFACYFDEFPSLKDYLDELQLFLYPYICEPHQKGISQKLWVNGNDEVLSDQFRTIFKCKQYKPSEIVEKMCAISKMQMLELEDV